ncbi:hypothetical protein SmphiM12_108 [Sinorhizobium phage phiM12]|uniref:Uncharacterized protein n=1 Tax=Sinorhizobium phage phiM12 TaxID=1357423 RepID=S5MPI5_9CAUD|nr:hypothetical protein AB690_gp088 [Sinorhizobium phage phiM12]AGR47740.1 hypothetical protein SmphiM12_108 [Sinorhizobium phage phiM12]
MKRLIAKQDRAVSRLRDNSVNTSRIENITISLARIVGELDNVLDVTTVVTGRRPPRITGFVGADDQTSNVTIQRNPTVNVVVTVVTILITTVENAIGRAREVIKEGQDRFALITRIVDDGRLRRRN